MTAPDPAPLAYNVEAAARVSGLSRATLYVQLASGELRSVKRAGRRLILADDLRAFLSGDAKTEAA